MRAWKSVGASIALGFAVTLVCLTSSKRSPSALEQVASQRVIVVHGAKIATAAEKSKSILSKKLVEELKEDECEEQHRWRAFCKRRAEDDDWEAKWAVFCKKKTVHTKDCDETDETQKELTKIHQGLIKSCRELLASTLADEACTTSSSSSSPGCQLSFCRQIIATDEQN
mmetsp:Transcript_101112/g.163106  ORF Transcript_101112/g.163106 Transcript_101112/m.163106 type:complete len:170 (-) Transcript_101112:642-1151(-)|eukprot:CAMPEP_0179431610 /NCGR_PEP_ID=MMETSP0799-20121207/16456_1 /TAXON_ID=46947 /ORGANISM="Geminigera cryophila, Strain CCMP2564" /LENGTH=169 /DNA_ID=CAMNT_0021208625 /DNA_START=37 /DNA_END=546 /DNA_ORIENTATION=+